MKNPLFYFAIITLLVIAKKFEARFLLVELNDETEAKPSHGRGLGLGRSKIIYLSLETFKKYMMKLILTTCTTYVPSVQ